MNRVNSAMNGAGSAERRQSESSDVDMDTCESGEDDEEEEEEATTSHNGVSNGVTNGAGGDQPDNHDIEDDDMGK